MADEDEDEDVFADKIVGKTMCEAADEGSMEEIQLAIGRNEGLDIPDPVTGDSALMKAIKGGYKEITQLLLDLGININLRNMHGDTALHWAEGARVKIRNEFGNDLMKMCSEHSIKMKVKAVKDEGERAIHKMKEEIAERLEKEKIAKALEQRNKEEEAKKLRESEAQVKTKRDAVAAEEKRIEDEDKARIQAELDELKRIEDERIAAELALKEEKARAKKAAKKGKKKK